MRTRPPRNRVAAGCLAAAVGALALAGATSGAGEQAVSPERWRSAFEARPDVELGERQIVVLAAPALADRVSATGALPAPKVQRRIVRRAEAFQRRLVEALRRQGAEIELEHSYTRTFNGFSAALDAAAAAALERAPGVMGVYPVRTVVPATLSPTSLGGSEAAAGDVSALAVPGRDGAGVTIALLDTGVDRSHPALRGRVLPGVDLVDGDAADEAERHGTRMAGLLVGREPAAGVARGATVLPIRVLGPTVGPDGPAYGGRSDVLLAGLERAVDPDGDGDVGDAAAIALAPLTAPFAGFPDGPEARAAAGTARLGTLLVAAAGNDGHGAPGFGTIGAPGGAPAALTVGALDTRDETLEARVRLTAGGRELYDGAARLLGPVPPEEGLELSGGSLVLLPADGTPVAPRVRDAAADGAEAVAVYGAGLPAGAVDVDARTALPIVALPLAAGEAAAEAAARGTDVTLSLGPVERRANRDAGSVAPFTSSGGLSGGVVKPDLVAPGVSLPTADAGGGLATVTGSSAAAAAAAGAAALVAQSRPDLDAAGLASALVGSARRVEASLFAAGAGAIEPHAALGARIAASPASVAVSLDGSARRGSATVELRNLGDEPLRVRLVVERDDGATSPVAVRTRPRRVLLEPGQAAEVKLAVASRSASEGTATGAVNAVAGGRTLTRIPWAVVADPAPARLVEVIALSDPTLARPGRDVSLLSFSVGDVRDGADGISVSPVALLEAELRDGAGKRLGVLARFRDLLPGRYVLGLTGRSPAGTKLPPGRYVVRLLAREAVSGEGRRSPVSVASASFRVTRR